VARCHACHICGKAMELWMIVTVHYTGPHGTARTAQAMDNDVGLPTSTAPPAQMAIPYQMCHIIQKKLCCV